MLRDSGSSSLQGNHKRLIHRHARFLSNCLEDGLGRTIYPVVEGVTLRRHLAG